MKQTLKTTTGTLKNVAISALLLTSIANAHAGFVKTDWKVEGDKQALLHEETGIEWLRLNQTKGKSINQVKALLDTTYAGWRLPTAEEVNVAVGTFLGLNFTAADYQYYDFSNSTWDAKAASFVSAFGQVNRIDYYTFSYGMYVNDKPNSQLTEALMAGLRYDHGTWHRAFIFDDYERGTPDFAHANYGVYLVSDGGTTLSSKQDPSINANNVANNVPVMFASLLPLFGLMLRRRRSL